MSANASALFACLLLMPLGACSDDAMPKWMTGEPTDAELAASPGTVALPPPSAANQPYPNLADVPLRPNPPLMPNQRADEIRNLKKENAEGQAAIAEYNADPSASVAEQKK